MRVVPAKAWDRGIDTITPLTDDSARHLAAAGCDFVARYLQHVSPAELAAIMGAGLLFSPISGYGRVGDWGEATGLADATSAIAAARLLGLPGGATWWLDLEGQGMGVSAATDYVSAWADAVDAAGEVPGLYVGSGCPLSPEQLYSLPVRAYWQSCSEVPTPARVGWQMLQLCPPNLTIAYVQVDGDVVQADRLGRVPLMISR
jgi:hypothetical protein